MTPQQQVEEAITTLVHTARRTYFADESELRGFALSFLLQYPDIHDALENRLKLDQVRLLVQLVEGP